MKEYQRCVQDYKRIHKNIVKMEKESARTAREAFAHYIAPHQ
jgi:hypothetical protein